jgi:hypothetical protein
MSKNIVVAAIAASVAAVAFGGGIIMDGQLDAGYGSALAVQDTQTQFGNSNLGQIDFANGSELDVAHGFIHSEAGILHLFLGGNLESNFNKLEVFLDFGPGGQNKLRGDNPDVDFNGLNRMGDDGSGNGLTFDAEFEADFYITMTGGNFPYQTFANTSEVLTNGGGSGGYIGSGGAGTNVLNGSNGTVIAIDNSNTGGVDGGTGPSSGAGVTTGIEISIPLSILAGYAGGDIKVTAFINGGGHDFLSNQVLAGNGGNVGNLGEPRFVNFGGINGSQYFVVEAPDEPVVGDLDGNGGVDGADLAILLGSWGKCGGCPADLNGDGVVDGADLAILLGAWG